MVKLLKVISVLICFHLFVVFLGWLWIYSPKIIFFFLLSLMVFSAINVFVGILFNRLRLLLKIAVISLSFSSLTLLSLFVFGFLCAIFAQNDFVGYSESFRFPLGDARGITVDSNGLVYCGSKFYNRLQVYDTDGKFLKGWFIPFPKGLFYIKITNNEVLQVFNSDGILHRAYDTKGNLLTIDKYRIDFDPELQYETRNAGGHLYKIVDRNLLTKVIKNTSDDEIVVIKDTIYQTVLKGPLPLLPIAILVFLFDALVIYNTQTRKLNAPCSPGVRGDLD